MAGREKEKARGDDGGKGLLITWVERRERKRERKVRKGKVGYEREKK